MSAELVTERLRRLSRSAQTGAPTFVVYGVGTCDAFIDGAAHRLDLGQALHDALAAAGFQRIVFFSLDHMLTVRDPAAVLRRGEPTGQAEDTGSGRGRVSRRMSGGPMGHYQVRTDAEGPGRAAAPAPTPPAGSGRMTDKAALDMIRGLMRQADVRTAVVLESIELLERWHGDLRDLATLLDSWLANRSGSANAYVLVFNQDSLAEVERFAESSRNLPRMLASAVRAERGRDDRPGLIGPPLEAELTTLIHRERIRAGLRIEDWKGLSHTVKLMARTRFPLYAWETRLRHLASQGATLDAATLRARGWISGPDVGTGTVWGRLAELKGLEPVREVLENLRWQPPAGREAPARHMVFTGNPGTGKTTIARLVGEIFLELGLLRSGHVVEVLGPDLISQYVGETALKTGQRIDEAMDGVLFIDEAYALDNSSHGKEAIDTLVPRMENDRGRLVVILAGYRPDIHKLLEANPGLRSRFPSRYHLHFPDHGPDVLLKIAHAGFAERGLAETPEFAEALAKAVERMYAHRDPESFGNARDIRELVNGTGAEWAGRVREDRELPLTPEDLPSDLLRTTAPPPAEELLAPLDALIGLGAVKDAVRDLVGQVNLARRRSCGEVVAPHMLFVGPPGTGKTTVAREIGTILHRLGLLGRDAVLEASREHLVAGYVGQTAIRTKKAINEATGGVLFIDEAYRLSRGGERDFGQEAIDTLVPEMENRRGRLVVIAACYTEEIEAFLAANPGLASRFTLRIDFPPYKVEELVAILRNLATAEGFRLTPEAEEPVRAWFAVAREQADFGNARTARGLFGEIKKRLAARVEADPAADHDEIRGEDVPHAGT
ncbi:AAA family ATPase [Actinomadura harenae]|uniref:AAA family ATPase n=1 Tax=Actinomadura harenae TaxID=2483351 RepID=A0A3M2LMY5_9ACTN|nr:AAA family ATPase [Actinomadura harenae]RMI38210.1 AAA family ATPase [Actinomadura harenae]